MAALLPLMRSFSLVPLESRRNELNRACYADADHHWRAFSQWRQALGRAGVIRSEIHERTEGVAWKSRLQDRLGRKLSETGLSEEEVVLVFLGGGG
jgi:hypothetical protein